MIIGFIPFRSLPPERALGDAQVADFPLECLSRNPQLHRRAARAGDTPFGFGERGLDQLLLAIGARSPRPPHSVRGLAALVDEPRLVDGKGFTVYENYGSLDHVLQLA